MIRRLVGFFCMLFLYSGIFQLNSYQKKNIKFTECDNLQIINFGPSDVFKGERFNVQPTGESAIWMKLNTDSKTTYGIAYINNTPLKTVVVGDMVTAVVPESIYKDIGAYPLTVALRLPFGMCVVPSKIFNVIAH